MVRVGSIVLNEKLIKYATPYAIQPREGSVNTLYPIISTKVVFLDNSEMIFEGMDCSILYSELDKLQNIKK